jgi:hypothetical protein
MRTFESMNDSRMMSKSQRLDEMGNGKRTAIVLIATLVICALVGIMVVGFRGRHIGRNAAAMATPVAGAAGSVTPRSAAAESPATH